MEPIDLAKQFSRLLCQHLGLKTIHDVCHLNQATEHEGVCASLAFCNAWAIMVDAYQAMTGQVYPPKSKEAFILANTAWEISKKQQFFVNELL